MEMETKRAGVTILISDKRDLNSKALTRNKGLYIMMKGSIQADMIIINIYALNI